MIRRIIEDRDGFTVDEDDAAVSCPPRPPAPRCDDDPWVMPADTIEEEQF